MEIRGEPRPDALRRQLAINEVPPGYLAYLDGEAVGWAGVSVRTLTPRLVNSRTIPGDGRPPGLVHRLLSGSGRDTAGAA